MAHPKNEFEVSDDSRIGVSMGTVWVILTAFFLIAVAFTGGVWKASATLSEIQHSIKELSSDKVSQRQARGWIDSFRELNPNSKVPPLPEPEQPTSSRHAIAAIVAETETRKPRE